MKLRDLIKCNNVNDGTRTLFESILVPEVAKAFKDWNSNTKDLKCVLIGGVALSYYVKPRTTTDADVLFLSSEDIPSDVIGFKRHRKGAFQHVDTHVKIEVLTPQSINMTERLAKEIYDNAKVIGGVRVATPSGLIASKLGRFKLQDQADIEELWKLGDIDMSAYNISDEWKDKLDKLVASI